MFRNLGALIFLKILTFKRKKIRNIYYVPIFLKKLLDQNITYCNKTSIINCYVLYIKIIFLL